MWGSLKKVAHTNDEEFLYNTTSSDTNNHDESLKEDILKSNKFQENVSLVKT